MGWSIVRAAVQAWAIVLLGIAGFSGTSVCAQTAPEPLGGDLLFQTMLSKPSNLDATLQYAVTSKDAGDIEAAIGALERLLFFNRNLSRVRFELGTLYFRLGSYEMARGYFESAQASPDATADLTQRAQEFLDKIDKKQQPDQWSGSAQTGLRFQSNASLGSNQQALLGATRPLNSQFAPQSDVNWFGIVALNYVHDFGNQQGDVFEASILGYDAQQFKVSAVDAGFVEIRAGPRFGVFQEILNGASIKPYIVATGVALGGEPYLGSIGGGVTMHFDLASVALDPYIEFRRMGYRNSSLYPLASGLNGTLSTYALQGGGQIFSGVRWLAKLAYNHSDDAFPWYSYDRYGFDILFPSTVPSPWGGRSWIVTPSFGFANWQYRQPDPTFSPFTREHDLEWRLGLGLDVPIYDRFGLGVQVQYRTFNSNIPGNTFEDLSVTLGPTVSF